MSTWRIIVLNNAIKIPLFISYISREALESLTIRLKAIYNTYMSIKKSVLFFNTIPSVIFAITLVLMSLLVLSPHASADTIDHGMQNAENCASGCTNNRGVVLKQEIVALQDKKDTPAPPPVEPYYVQLRSLNFPQPNFPSELFYSSSFKPPDLNLLNSVFRI